MNTATALDPRFRPNAYVREGTTVYQVLGQERDDEGAITGMYVLENIVGEYSCGSTYVHRRIVRSPGVLFGFELVKAAPDIGSVPAYLDAQMSEHLRDNDLA